MADRSDRTKLLTWAVVAGAALVALVSARPYAGGWNDGSRLATVEALVDHHTLQIDRSVFVDVPPGRSPYTPGNTALARTGTCDKVYIRGHFYSDKPALISLLIAAEYQAWRWLGAPAFAQRPDVVSWALTVGTSGLAYVAAVWCLWLLTLQLGLPRSLGLPLTLAFALASVALPYVRHVNNHVMLLGVMAGIVLSVARLADEAAAGRLSWRRLAWLGTLAGVGFNLDLGLGPALLLGLGALIGWRTRRWSAVGLFVLTAGPWVLAQLGLNYAIGGVWKPINTVPEYAQWPNGPFTPANLTGFIRHGPAQQIVYALALLFGHHGIYGHNLPFLLVLPASLVLWWRRLLTPEHIFCLAWCTVGWLSYAVFSNNYGGQCCSIRWFVPFLAPWFYLLADFLRRRPDYRWDLYVLSAWGAGLAALMWWHGPWMERLAPGFWPIQAGALASWAACRCWRLRAAANTAPSPASPRPEVLSFPPLALSATALRCCSRLLPYDLLKDSRPAGFAPPARTASRPSERSPG